MTDVASPKVVVDRRVPLWGIVLLAIGMLGQAGVGISSAAKASQRLDSVEASTAELKDVPGQLQRLDERTVQMQHTLDQIAARQ